VHTDQWRYERNFSEYHPVPEDDESSKGLATGHTMDLQAKAVRLGWLPFYPQFNRNSLDLVKEAEESGAKTDKEIIEWVVKQFQ
jgi:nitrate reductase alpha subunit